MSGTILLADDSLTIQKVVELTFADTDYRVVAVSSGDELLDRLGSASPDLIICDVIMPGKDGYEVCQKIKSSPSWLHLPVILLTGTFEPFDRDRAIAAGCSEIITKPFEARKLVDTVERLIGGSGHQVPAADETDQPGPAVEAPAEAAVTPPVDVPVAEVPVPETVEEFGTQLSEPESAEAPTEKDGIEFTTSGFAEMEAAGQSAADASEGEPDDGLDFEFGDGSEGLDESAEVKPPPVADLSAQTVRIEVPPMTEADSGDVEPPTEEAVEVEAEPVDEAPEPVDEAPEPVDATPEDEPEGDGEGGFQDEPSMADTSPVDPPAEESTGPVEAPPEESTAPVEVAAPEESTAPVEVSAPEESTAPVEAVAPEESTAPIEPPPEKAEGRLSDDEVDRIARRVFELASDRLDQIAWEVVPDMAEIVVRQRVRELEEEAGEAAPETVQ